MPPNVRPRAYAAVMAIDTLLPDIPRPPRRYMVTVTLSPPEGDGRALPQEAHAVAELTAAAVAAQGLVTAWTSARAVLSMVVESSCQADALAAGVAVVRALGGEQGASVEAEPVPVPH